LDDTIKIYSMDVQSYLNSLGKAVAVIGSQWGDEGKGKLVDILASKYDTVARGTGGANAGHTIIVEGKKHVFHLLPSGILYENNVCIVGNGCVIDVETMLAEVVKLKDSGIEVENRLFVSDKAHVVFPFHKEIDGIQEDSKGDKKVGTTKRGIGPTYADKISRIGVRIGDLLNKEVLREKLTILLERNSSVYGLNDDLDEYVEKYYDLGQQIIDFIADTVNYLNHRFDKKDSSGVLFEGANATFLDIDHGTYPYVTSSNATISGLLSGTGFAPTKMTDVFGIVKAYTTRVGAGPFVTELLEETGELIRTQGHEFGSTTGRPRRCGWYDAFVVKLACQINGFTALNLTKLDVLQGLETLKIATAYVIDGAELESLPMYISDYDKIEVTYTEMPGFTEDISKVRKFEDLPVNAQNYVLQIEKLAGVKITCIGVGPERDQMVFR
jgi:adenylosuccinate synthase